MPSCITSHGLNTISGYIVRRTFFDATPHVDEITLPEASSFGLAVEAAHAIRNEPDHTGYAVVDPLYACGCRGRG